MRETQSGVIHGPSQGFPTRDKKIRNSYHLHSDKLDKNGNGYPNSTLICRLRAFHGRAVNNFCAGEQIIPFKVDSVKFDPHPARFALQKVTSFAAFRRS
jgi:hypothetical protein